jgi:HSP20 family protein
VSTGRHHRRGLFTAQWREHPGSRTSTTPHSEQESVDHPTITQEERAMTLSVPPTSRVAARWDPFRELDELYNRMNHLWESGVTTDGAADRWVPLADIEETDDAYVLELDLPGVDKDDVDIEINGRELTVSGEIKEKERAGILRRRTRKVGEFNYSVTMPMEIDAESVRADLDGGVLTITVPKSQKAKSRHIPVGS